MKETHVRSLPSVPTRPFLPSPPSPPYLPSLPSPPLPSPTSPTFSSYPQCVCPTLQTCDITCEISEISFLPKMKIYYIQSIFLLSNPIFFREFLKFNVSHVGLFCLFSCLSGRRMCHKRDGQTNTLKHMQLYSC